MAHRRHHVVHRGIKSTTVLYALGAAGLAWFFYNRSQGSSLSLDAPLGGGGGGGGGGWSGGGGGSAPSGGGGGTPTTNVTNVTNVSNTTDQYGFINGSFDITDPTTW